MPTPPSRQEIAAISQLETRLSARVGKIVHVTVTRNRVRMVSFKSDGTIIRLRIHEKFLFAPPEVINALAGWMDSPKRGVPEQIRNFVRGIEVSTGSQSSQPDPNFPPLTEAKDGTLPLPLAPPDTVTVQHKKYLITQGFVHDLAPLARSVNQEYFNNRITASITWGRDNTRQRARTRRLGSYRHDLNLITIHPVMDQPDVPERVVRFIIFHEMLHALQPKGKKRVHDKAFREKERTHPDYEWVQEWQDNNRKLIHGGGKKSSRN